MACGGSPKFVSRDGYAAMIDVSIEARFEVGVEVEGGGPYSAGAHVSPPPS